MFDAWEVALALTASHALVSGAASELGWRGVNFRPELGRCRNGARETSGNEVDDGHGPLGWI